MLIPDVKIGLFIDADNASSKKIDQIISTLAEKGAITIKRAYGNWTKDNLKSWEAKLHAHGIQPFQQFDLTKGKNASDIALCIDVMDILYTKQIDVYAIITSDCDFTPLAMRLQAEGKVVIGFGNSTSPEPFMNSCTKFVCVDRLKDQTDKEIPRMERMPSEEIVKDTRLISLIRDAIYHYQNESGWAMLGPVGSHIGNMSSIVPENYGYLKMGDLIKAIDLFEVKIEGDDNHPYIREKNLVSDQDI